MSGTVGFNMVIVFTVSFLTLPLFFTLAFHVMQMFWFLYFQGGIGDGNWCFAVQAKTTDFFKHIKLEKVWNFEIRNFDKNKKAIKLTCNYHLDRQRHLFKCKVFFDEHISTSKMTQIFFTYIMLLKFQIIVCSKSKLMMHNIKTKQMYH